MSTPSDIDRPQGSPAETPADLPGGTSPVIDDEVDTRGLLCPLPVLKARKRLQGMAPGAVLMVRADDPAALVDVPHFCAEQGHDLVSQTDADDGSLAFLIRKG